MSLDITLYSPEVLKKECHCCGQDSTYNEYVFSANITHNLNKMASEAGIYKHVWRPAELQITKAKELIDPLTKAIKDMNDRPDHYKKFDSDNGWGTYKDFVPWFEKYLDACINYPESIIHVNR